ncbi:HlyD family type I secretion periplasmic adaptor subunit [Desulfotalea psychrophila]|uniref:Related to secretion protein n=1 Tax=Desulfotalea psychrophila (strain LSv54 / DSM 12343) TaxID=177439 RepID=Q6AQY1_DESPS|nr:HlyD family type I secretion periplasmic adaptor subunit [Desulfotalea psychrophila]CAG35243.1 related to secretion protein [Desulfotalea psychrophila LSv54]
MIEKAKIAPEANNHKAKKTRPAKPGGNYNKRDVEFMNSLSGALLASRSSRLNVLLYVICAIILTVVTWCHFAELDERTRGIGRTIPSRQIQVVQNLEGGIIKEIHVFEGESVKRGQILVTIDDTGIGSSYSESASKINELEAKSIRLSAESGITDTLIASKKETDSQMVQLMKNEKRLYNSQLRQHENQKSVLQQQLQQRKIELQDAQEDLKSFRSSQKMLNREIALSRPLLKKQLLSELEFLQLEQRDLEKKQEVNRTINKVESLNVQIIEAKEKIEELDETRQAEAMEELNAVVAEIDRLAFMQVAIEDRVTRTSVRSPVNGTVKQLLINTVGGVVRPGMDILEIVPTDEAIMVETKIKPSDIAFIYPGQKAILKFTAYDYAIYGGLDGEVALISADTITDEKGEEFYLVRVKSKQNYLGNEDSKKQIMIGMTAQVDIITGKKSVMQYLMKPILRAKNNALRER